MVTVIRLNESLNISKGLYMINTPYYVLDIQKLKANLLGLRIAFDKHWPNSQISYSFKTNNLPWVANWMRKNDVYAEVVSTPEYELAATVGYNRNHIILNGPYKGNDTLVKAIQSGSIVNLDSFEEIDFLLSNQNLFNGEFKIGLRINFDLESKCPGETIPGEEAGRFGFNVENGDFEKAISLLKQNNIKVVGLHGHHSTKTKSLGIFKAITNQLCECSKSIDKLEYIDLGGCLFGDKPGAPSFDDYIGTISSVLKFYNISDSVKLYIEPGAALIASPFSYVCSVIGKKTIKDTMFIYTDGSMKHIAPQMSKIKFAYSRTKSLNTIIPRQVVTGFTCIEMDRFLDIENQTELIQGDKITIYNTGAYTISLAPLFIEYFPAVYVKDGDSYLQIRKPWTIEQFLQNNIIE